MEFFHETFSLFTSPEQRLYWPILLGSLLIGLFYSRGFEFFGKKGILHPSSLFDLKLLLLNNFFKVTLFPLLLLSSYEVSVVIYRVFANMMPGFQGWKLGSLEKSIIATLFAFVVSDFLRFLQHVLMHETPILKKIHRTHHSAEVLTPFTLFRTHPMESFFGSFRSVFSTGLTIACYSFFFQELVPVIDILGVNAFGFIFNAMLANLRHSPIPISFGSIEYVLISPRMHQIHHSKDPRHYNKNYGVALALWDQLWGSYYRPQSEEANNLTFGLTKIHTPHTLKSLLPAKV